MHLLYPPRYTWYRTYVYMMCTYMYRTVHEVKPPFSENVYS